MTTLGYKLHLFPFEQVEKGEEIILYGFGNMGQQYYWQIRNKKYCRVKYIVDKRWDLPNCYGIDIKSPDILRSEQNVKVVIGVQKKRDEIIKTLKDYGLNDNQVVWSDEYVLVPVTDQNAYVRAEKLSFSAQEYIEKYGNHSYECIKQVRERIVANKENGNGNKASYVRVGNDYDGGYIMLDTLDANDEKIAYSFGIADDVSWDNDMADKGYNVYMYDHTIDSLPFDREEFHFTRKGISDSSIEQGDLKMLKNLIRENGHQNNKKMILKMDVEGAEYGFINNTERSELLKFDQIVLELHNLLNPEISENIINAINKLEETHKAIHIHANNLGTSMIIDGNTFADCIEITFVNRENYNDIKVCDRDFICLELDRPCWPEISELWLE